MPVFAPPIADHLYTLYDLLGFEQHNKLPGFQHCTRDVIEAVLEQSARFSSEVLYPLHRSADEEGVHFENGMVRTPKGFREAYAQLVEGGWPALTAAPEHGGQGMPHMVNFLFEEMINGANLSFGLFPGLTRGAYVALAQHGNAEQQALYAAKLASGEWAGSMCLTEAHCGTDLGLLKTQAMPNGDGSYALTGTKIFISAGEHDLTPNIIYLVLARLPDAPKGSKGIRWLIGCAQWRVLRVCRAQDGHPWLPHLRHEFRRRHRLADGRAAPGPEGDVRHDEYRAHRSGHPWPRDCRGLLRECRGLCA
jgi:butyryl-CoA dehydrogenase